MSDSERPIEGSKEDLLRRGEFVRRLTLSLVDTKHSRATGAIVGLTGPWGSGKSSLLNLIQEAINGHHPDAVVVRFDPWLVSGRGDLIAQFMAELAAAISDNPPASEKLRAFTAVLSKYGGMLAPGANLIAPALGTAIGGGFKALETATSRSVPLHAERSKLKLELEKSRVPIIVLIDEVDRLEDDEIVSLAQLVKSVIDLPHVSFVIAYDVERVMEALGRGRPERGRSYLEKIISIQIPIPFQTPEERSIMLRKGLLSLGLSDFSNERQFRNPRYLQLEEIILRDIILTPRDIKRLVASFAVLYRMLEDDVDTIDVLGYSTIVAKYPKVAEILKREGERVVADPIDKIVIDERFRLSAQQLAEIAGDFVGEDAPSGAFRLFRFLFPLTCPPDTIRPQRHPNAVAKRRPLLNLLRLGVPAGGVSPAEAGRVLSLGRSKAKGALESHAQQNTLGALLDRVESIYHLKPKTSRLGFWLGAGDFIGGVNFSSSWQERTLRRNAFDAIAEIPVIAAQRGGAAQDVLLEDIIKLVEEGEIHVAPRILRAHFAPYRMFGYSGGSLERTFIPSEKVRHLSTVLGESISINVLSGAYFDRAISFDGLWLVKSLKLWASEHTSMMQQHYESSDGAEHLAFILASGPRGADAQTVQNLGFDGRLRSYIQERLQMIDRTQEAPRYALRSLLASLPV